MHKLSFSDFSLNFFYTSPKIIKKFHVQNKNWHFYVFDVLKSSFDLSRVTKEYTRHYVNYNSSYLNYFFVEQKNLKKLLKYWTKFFQKKKKTNLTLMSLKTIIKFNCLYESFFNIFYERRKTFNVFFHKHFLYTSLLKVFLKNFEESTLKYSFQIKVNDLNQTTPLFLLKLNISKRQFFATQLDYKLTCLQNYSCGVILKKLKIIDKKYLKKSHEFWFTFLKITKSKFTENKKKLKKTINFFIKGHLKYFIKILLYLFKLNFMKYCCYIILQFSLTFCLHKYKKIKAIKRKLTKKYLKINGAQNIELRRLKNQLY